MSLYDHVRTKPRLELTRLDDHAPGEPMLRLSGLLDAEAATRLAEALSLFLDEGLCRIHLDLSLVSMITSSGVGSLVSAIGECREAEGDLVLHDMSPQVRGLLDLLSLGSYVTVGD